MIRIVAGKVGKRRLNVPKGRAVRPTADRVREALFSSLGRRVENARVLDLFAGTGALGIEALSRGADFAVFVEHARQVRETLERNLAELRLAAESKVIPIDALKAVSMLKTADETFDLIFLDPPYAGELLEKSIKAICEASLLSSDGMLVAEHAAYQTLPDLFPSASLNNLQKVAAKSYGDTGLTFFEYAGQAPDAKENDPQCR